MNRLSRYFVFLVILLASCSPGGPGLPLWLEGEWKTNNESGFAGEYWRLENDTLLSGQGMVHIAGQLKVMEEISIFIRDDQIYYGANVIGQNQGRRILFRATYIADGHLVFENPQHDFPTRIVYKLKDSDTLEVNISGRDEEDSKTIEMYRR